MLQKEPISMSELEKIFLESSTTIQSLQKRIAGMNSSIEEVQREFFLYSVQKMSKLVEYQFHRLRSRSH